MILFPLEEASRSVQAHESGESRKNILRQFEASSLDRKFVWTENARKSPLQRSKIYNIIFWNENDTPPPFGTFLKIHLIWLRDPSLTMLIVLNFFQPSNLRYCNPDSLNMSRKVVVEAPCTGSIVTWSGRRQVQAKSTQALSLLLSKWPWSCTCDKVCYSNRSAMLCPPCFHWIPPLLLLVKYCCSSNAKVLSLSEYNQGNN